MIFHKKETEKIELVARPGKGLKVVPIQLLLVFSEVDAEDVLVLGLKVRDENIVVKTLHAAFEQVGQDETPSLHDPNVPLS